MNEAVIDTVQTLCREGNRDSVLTAFQNFPEHFSCIPLNDSNVESKQAINDLLRENVSSASALSVPTLLTSVPRHFANLPDHPDLCVEVAYVMGSAQRARRARLNSPRNMGLCVFREQVELARNDTTSGGNDIKQRTYDTHSSVREAAPSAPSLANHLWAAWTTLPSLRSRHSLRAAGHAHVGCALF